MSALNPCNVTSKGPITYVMAIHLPFSLIVTTEIGFWPENKRDDRQMLHVVYLAMPNPDSLKSHVGASASSDHRGSERMDIVG